MPSYKVEIKAYGKWFPASSKYFKEYKRAENFQQRLIKQHLKNDKSLSRIKPIGKFDLFNPFMIGIITTFTIMLLIYMMVVIV